MVAGRYFPHGSARFFLAYARLTDARILRIENESGSVLAEVPLRRVRISHRLGNVVRRFELPDGAHFEADDNDAVDAMLAGIRHGTVWIDRLERSYRWVLAALLLAAGAVVLFLEYGIPALAQTLAAETPANVMHLISRETMRTLESFALKPSRLSRNDRAKASALFAKIASAGPRGAGGYRLEFRSAPALGPNAFALPDGTIVMTDQLWPEVHADGEIEGVFAHEMSHIDRRHGMQSLYQAAIVPAAIALVTGDASQLTQIGTILPGILVQSAYSRRFEQQADDDAAHTLLRAGVDPAGLAHLLERIEGKVCGKKGCGPSWLGNHPLTSERVTRLLSERKNKN